MKALGLKLEIRGGESGTDPPPPPSNSCRTFDQAAIASARVTITHRPRPTAPQRVDCFNTRQNPFAFSVTTMQPFDTAIAAMIVSNALRGRPFLGHQPRPNHLLD